MANGLFTPGTGTLKSTTLPNALFELLVLIQRDERIANNNAQVLRDNNIPIPNNVSISLNYENRSTNISVNIPLTFELLAGELKIKAVDYLEPISNVLTQIDNTLNITGSSLTKTNKIEALFELIQLIQLEEESKNINRLNFVMRGDEKTSNFSGSLFFLPSINNLGKLEFEIYNYLA